MAEFNAGSIVANIKANLTEFKEGMNTVRKEAQTMADKVKTGVANMNQGIEKMTPTLQKASLAIGAAGAVGVLILKDWTDAARGAEVATAQFNATMERAGDASGEASKQILDAAAAATKLGFDDEDAANVMANFYQRTNDVTESIKLNNVAMDLARKKNIDLSSAAGLVTQVLSGNGRVLKQYGIDIKETASPMEALAQLQQVVGGQADAFLNTSAGKMEAFNVKLGNIKETLGGALLPVMDQFVTMGTRILEWFESLSPQTQAFIAKGVALATALALITAPLLIFVTMIPSLIAGFTAIGAAIALLFSPITVVVGLFIGLGLIIYKYREEFAAFFQILSDNIRAFLSAVVETWNASFEAVQSVVTTAFDFILGYVNVFWETLRLYFKVAMALLTGDWKGAWKLIQDWALNVFNVVKEWATQFWDGLSLVFQEGGKLLGQAWENAMQGVKNMASSVWEGIKDIFKNGINWLIDKLNGLISGFNGIASKVTFGAVKGAIPNIPRLAEGAVVRARPGGIVANIGEGKYDEAVVPLNGKGGGLGNTFIFQGPVWDKSVAREMMDDAIRGIVPNIS